MDKTCHLAELSPAYSHSTCVSTKTRAHHGGFLYDDYAREIPVAPVAKDWQARSLTPETFKSPRYIAICLAVVLFVVQLGASLADVPATRLLENVVCHQLSYDYSASVMPQSQCRGIGVQAELNVLSMGTLLFGYLPGVLVAVPYGILSDRFGRKAVLALSVFGMVVSQLLWTVVAWNWRRWDLRYTWTSSAALLVGGGESVAQAMVFAMIADVAPQDKRATYFNIEMSAVIFAQAVAPFIAAPMMTYSLWLPVLAAPGILAAGGFLIPIIPNTLGMRRYHEMYQTKSSQSPSPELFRRLPRQTSNFDPWATPWSRIRDNARATIRLLQARDVNLLLPCASLIVPVFTVSMNIILRYIPVRFGWTLAQTGMLLGARTGLTILVLAVALPLSTWFFSKTRREKRDLVMARVSIAVLVAGYMTLAAATSIIVAVVGLVILTLGSAAPALCRVSLLRLATRDQGHPIGQVLGLLALCEAVGYVVCSVGFGALYQWCIHFAQLGTGYIEDTGGLGIMLYVATAIIFTCGWMLGFMDVKTFLCGEEANLEEGAVSSASRRSALLAEGEKSLHEARVSADVRIVRKGPFLETVCLAA